MQLTGGGNHSLALGWAPLRRSAGVQARRPTENRTGFRPIGAATAAAALAPALRSAARLAKAFSPLRITQLVTDQTVAGLARDDI